MVQQPHFFGELDRQLHQAFALFVWCSHLQVPELGTLTVTVQATHEDESADVIGILLIFNFWVVFGHL